MHQEGRELYTYNMDPHVCFLLLHDHRPSQATFMMTVDRVAPFMAAAREFYGPTFMSSVQDYTDARPPVAAITIAIEKVYHTPAPAVST